MTLTTDLQTFLRAIQAEPDNDIPRLVYADWLDKCGDPDGELVRLLCEVQRPTTCNWCKGDGGWCESDGDNVLCGRCGGEGVAAYQPGPIYERLEHLTGGLDATIERLSERERRLFACDCAERVLPLFEREYPGDERPRRAVETARRYARQADNVLGLEHLSTARTAAWQAVLNRVHHGESLREVVHAVTWCCAYNGATAAQQSTPIAAAQAADPAAERRWQLCRAVEYRLGFVGGR